MTYFFLSRGQLCNCIVQLKSKNTKTPLSSNVSFFILGVLKLFYCAIQDKTMRTPPNKSVMTNESCKKTKTPLNQKQSFFLVKAIIVVNSEVCLSL